MSSAKTAFCFPGVGVEHCGKELNFFENNLKTMAPFIEAAGNFLGKDLISPFRNQEISLLSDREQQFFTYGYSVGAAEVCIGVGLALDYTAGYSFGVYGALYACGSVSFKTGLEILDQAYHVMENALPKMPCGMGVIVGLSIEEVLEILEEGEFPSISLTVVNSSACQVVSGYKEPLQNFLKRSLERDAISAELLPVEIPYHHSELLKDAALRFRSFLKDAKVENPVIPLISSIDQRLLVDANSSKEFIAMNLCSPINWMAVVSTLSGLGVTKIVECGPGISLSQNSRFMPFEKIEYLSVKNLNRKLRI